jgi:ABC-type uncharacterized transport system permease subunit
VRRGGTDRLSNQLPNLEWLEHCNRHAIGLGFLLYTVGLALGLGMLVIKGEDIGMTDRDLKVVSAVAVWALFAALVALGARPRFRGRPVARLTLVAFVLMILVIDGGEFMWRSSHTFGPPADRTETR